MLEQQIRSRNIILEARDDETEFFFFETKEKWLFMGEVLPNSMGLKGENFFNFQLYINENIHPSSRLIFLRNINF